MNLSRIASGQVPSRLIQHLRNEIRAVIVIARICAVNIGLSVFCVASGSAANRVRDELLNINAVLLLYILSHAEGSFLFKDDKMKRLGITC